jgi:hypothetical protein
LKLHIYDFDGTLFGSPNPPEGWPHSVGSWWSDAISLTEPCVPHVPGDSWWNSSIVSLAKKSIADPDTLAILMTGRPNYNAGIRFRIAELLSQKELDFAFVFLKTKNARSTVEFKASRINAILSRRSDITEAEFWDDRHHHLPEFIATAERHDIPGFGHPVPKFQRQADCSSDILLKRKH